MRKQPIKQPLKAHARPQAQAARAPSKNLRTQFKQIEEDISNQKPLVSGAIDLVGIEDLEMPIRIQSGSKILSLPAVIRAQVSLEKGHRRGIHMSRIYLTLHDFLEKQVLTLAGVQKLLKQLVKSQKGLSKKAQLHFKWTQPVKRKALKSEWLEGWRCYPMCYHGEINTKGQTVLSMGMEVTYSSTCPCSARLARTLIQKKFHTDFSADLLKKQEIMAWLGKESSISATPHAQKSCAKITLQAEREEQSLLTLIDEVEKALGTPVQTAVKRADEQEFAKLNSENLMFSEDAARRITHLLSQKRWVRHCHVHVKHFESLHPFEVACQMST